MRRDPFDVAWRKHAKAIKRGGCAFAVWFSLCLLGVLALLGVLILLGLARVW